MKDFTGLEKIFDFLSFELSEDGYSFFGNIKRSFSGKLELFAEFVVDYLTIQNNGKKPLDVYSSFVVYFNEMLEIQSEESLLEQFARYAKYFLMLSFEYMDSQQIKAIVSEINERNIRQAYPFLMELMDDYENERITEDAFINLSQNILGMAENADDNEFAHLSLAVNQMLYDSAEHRRAS